MSETRSAARLSSGSSATPAGFGTSNGSIGPGAKLPPAPDTTSATTTAIATGRQRGEGRRPSGKNSNPKVTRP